MEGALASPLDEVWARLDLVMDPELDEPVTDMGFIEAVAIAGPTTGHNNCTVEISFRLPTYWCSPNFAFLMAQGIKREVETLPWVGRAVITLQDHMSAAEMNAVVNSGGVFSDVFADLSPGENLDELREKFDQKAFQRRQETVIRGLLAQGYVADIIVNLTLSDLSLIPFDDAEVNRQRIRYVTLLTAKNIAQLPTDLAFPTYQGVAIGEDFKPYMDLLRSVRINMEFSGSLCRNLKQSRYLEADLSGAVPILVTVAPSDHACR